MSPDSQPRALVGGRSAMQRRDSRANRQRLLDATGRLLAAAAGPRSLQHVASEAGLSAATAYRHFASLDAALQAYAHETVLSMGEFATTQTGRGVERLRALSERWVELTRERGPAMVHLRSRRGFLERRRAGEPIIRDTCAYLEPAMAEVLDDEDISADQLEFALFLWNVLFDPREILDLHETAGWRDREIVDRLLAAFSAGLRTAQNG
jgi:AcrR family transcriptional regulator